MLLAKKKRAKCIHPVRTGENSLGSADAVLRAGVKQLGELGWAWLGHANGFIVL
jgi:hypothetical protein